MIEIRSLSDGAKLWDIYSETLVGASMTTWACKPEWEKQINIYAAMFRRYGFPVYAGNIVAMLKDWSANEARRRREDYPQVPVVSIDIPMWEDGEALEYIQKRVELMESHRDTPDDDLPMCEKHEMWKKDDMWAVVPDGAKKAIRLFSTHGEAEEYADNYKPKKFWAICDVTQNAVGVTFTKKKDAVTILSMMANPQNYSIVEKHEGKATVVLRRGVAKKCTSYCPAHRFCNQYKEMAKNGEVE